MSPTHIEPDAGSGYSTPRWVKVFGIIFILLVLLVVVVVITGLGGDHGPGRHLPFGNANGSALPVEQETQLDIPVGHTPPIEHSVQQP